MSNRSKPTNAKHNLVRQEPNGADAEYEQDFVVACKADTALEVVAHAQQVIDGRCQDERETHYQLVVTEVARK
jgi:hypothetical protein